MRKKYLIYTISTGPKYAKNTKLSALRSLKCMHLLPVLSLRENEKKIVKHDFIE
jgi:hypothetical protein